MKRSIRLIAACLLLLFFCTGCAEAGAGFDSTVSITGVGNRRVEIDDAFSFELPDGVSCKKSESDRIILTKDGIDCGWIEKFPMPEGVPDLLDQNSDSLAWLTEIRKKPTIYFPWGMPSMESAASTPN